MRVAIALVACVAAFTLTGCFEGPRGDKGDKGDTGTTGPAGAVCVGGGGGGGWPCRPPGFPGKEPFDSHQSSEWYLPGCR